MDRNVLGGRKEGGKREEGRGKVDEGEVRGRGGGR
jgi:hypothetical protein